MLLFYNFFFNFNPNNDSPPFGTRIRLKFSLYLSQLHRNLIWSLEVIPLFASEPHSFCFRWTTWRLSLFIFWPNAYSYSCRILLVPLLLNKLSLQHKTKWHSQKTKATLHNEERKETLTRKYQNQAINTNCQRDLSSSSNCVLSN